NGYDWEVSRVDRSIGRIDAYLKKSNLLEKTHSFLLADHGESLGDHNESRHGFFIYDSTLHVPLIVRPAVSFTFSQRLVKQAVSLIDVMPTVLEIAGLRKPADVQGRSVVGMMLGKVITEKGLYAETHFPQLRFDWSPLRSFRLGGYKFIDAPRPEFYDIAEDPGEEMNLFSEKKALAKQYRKQLEKLVARYQNRDGGSVADLDRETTEKLAALGYVRLSRSKIRSGFGKGVDPKDRIDAFESYQQVSADIHGDLAKNIFDQIEEIRKQVPEMRGLFFLEAMAHERLENLGEAYKGYGQALRKDPDNNLARANRASVMIRLGKRDQAEKELRVVLATDPNDYRSRNNLALLYRMKGRVQAAIAELEKVVESAPGYAAGWFNLGQFYAQVQKWEDAEFSYRKALNLDKKSALAHFNLAHVLTAMGKTVEAKRQMQIALELDPRLANR
ncbi:tetratricopeptide repeat protein, partial [Acidobacteria bacterium AH-259-O06]|nr:tetratricopeptide repeat protein [Acidobacteria bacterium AH-259-O06]